MKRRTNVGRSVRDLVAGSISQFRGTKRRSARSRLGLGTRRLRSEPLEQRCLLSLTTFVDSDFAWDTANGGDMDNDGLLSSGDVVSFMSGETGQVDDLVFGLDAFESIQEAIDATDPGGTVTVGPGEYLESLAIFGDLTLTGATGVASDVVINSMDNTGILIAGQNVTVENLQVTMALPGIMCDGGLESSVTIDNVELVFDSTGILVGSGSVLVTNSMIQGSLGEGISLWGGTTTIDQNNIVDNITGIFVDEGASARVTNNAITSSDGMSSVGGMMIFGGNVLLEGNDLTGNLVALSVGGGNIDAGQAEDGVDFTGLGISSGGNDFSSYIGGLVGLGEGAFDVIAFDGVSGPQGLPPAGTDIAAHGNIWFSDNPLDIEEVVYHDADDSFSCFVDYADLGDLTLSTSQAQVGEDTVTTLTGSFTNDPQTHEVLIDWGDGQTESVALDAGTWTFAVDHIYAGGGGGEVNVDDATFATDENTLNGTLIGTVTGSSASAGGTIAVSVSDVSGGLVEQTVDYGSGGGGGPLTYSIVGGTGATAFAVDPTTGEITVADQTQLDYEYVTSYTLVVEGTDGSGVDTGDVTIELINRPSVTGSVFVDVNENGLYDANEPTIDGVTVELLDSTGAPVLDSAGNPVTAVTENGFYLFEDLVAGTYQLHEVQPTGVDDGAELVGDQGGTVPANDTMQIELAATDAQDYFFAELGQDTTSGDSASTGFWNSRRGRNLIIEGGTDLANWLTDNFGNIFGDELVGADGADVARFYRTEIFRHRSLLSVLTAKVDIEFMSIALATYFTNSSLAGNVADAYGFNVTQTGIGTNIVNVGISGEAFGVADYTDMTIMQILSASNSLTDSPDNISGYTNVYDTDGDGRVSLSEAYLRVLAHNVYDSIIRDGR